MNKYVIIFISLLLIGLSGYPVEAKQVKAQDATDSGQTYENLRKRIDKLVEEKREQIKGVLSDTSIKKRGFIGEVQRVSEDTITVKSKNGTHILSVEGVSLQKSAKTIKVDDIAVGDWVIVLGFMEGETFAPRRILVSSTTLLPPVQIVNVGTISAFDRTSVTIEKRNKEETLTVTTDRNTVYEDLDGDEIARTTLERDTQALVVGFDEGGKKTATKIRVLIDVPDDN